MSALSGKTVLVTGGAGFIGSHLIDRLVSENPKKVIVIDNLSLGREENLESAKISLGDKLACYWFDACDLEKVQKVIEDENVEVVYDLAVIPLPASLKDPYNNVLSNVSLSLVLCELLRLKKFDTLIHFSSSEVYGTAQYVPIDEGHPFVTSTPYAASKAGGDQLCLSYAKTFDLDIRILRPFNNYGPRQNSREFAGIIPIVMNNYHRKEPVTIFGDGEQTRDLIFVEDTAEAAVRMYENESTRGLVTNIGSGIETSINKLVATMLEQLGESDWEVNHTDPRPSDVRRHCAGVKRAQELINFEPQTSLDIGLKQTIDWYLSSGENG